MKKAFILFSCAIVFYTCKKDTTATNPPSSSTAGNTGTITGKVTQYDQYSIQNTTGLNGVAVSIDGTSYSTTTDANGNYTLTNVSPGTYKVSFNKTGCALWQQQQVSFAGNGTYYLNGYLLQRPTYSFFNTNVRDSFYAGGHRILVSGSLSPLPEPFGIMVLSGKNANLDISNPTSYDNAIIQGWQANASGFSFMTAYGTSGTTTYYKVYPYPNAPIAACYYYDYPSGKNVFSAYGNVVPTTFTVTIP